MYFKKLEYQLLIFFLIFSFKGFGQVETTPKSLNYKEAIALALKQNHLIKGNLLKIEKAIYRQKDVYNERLPNVDLGGGFDVLANIRQYEEGLFHSSTLYKVPRLKYDLALEAEVPIYLGGKLKLEDKKAEIEKENTVLQSQWSEKELKLEMVLQYLGILHLEEQLRLIQRKMKEDSIVIDQTLKLKNNGLVTQNEVLRTQLQLSHHLMAKGDLENEIKIKEHQIKTLLALPEEVAFKASTEGLLSSDSSYTFNTDNVLENHQKYTVLQNEVKLKKLDKALLRASLKPQVVGLAHYGFYYPNFMFFPPQDYLYRFGSIGFKFKIPLSSHYKNNVKYQMLDTQIALQEEELSEKEEQIMHEVYAAQVRLEDAAEKIEIADVAIAQAAENYRIVRLKYGNQLSLITELIDADNAYLEAQSKLISLKINKEVKYYQLQYALGKL